MRTSNAAPREACWLAQQAAEKALKAALVYMQKPFPRTHDLVVLRNLLPPDWVPDVRGIDLAALTLWAIEARYPGDWPDATDDDSDQAVANAAAVLDAVAHGLTLRGLGDSPSG